MTAVNQIRDQLASQLSRELARSVYELTDRAAVRREIAFRDQVIDSAGSASRNIAEGFRRFRPRDFSRFLTIAAASIAETENHLEDGVDRKLWTRQEIAEALTLCRRAGSAIGGLQRYLSKCDPKFDTGRVPDPKLRTRTTGTPRTEPMEPSEPAEPEEQEER
jgi:four helix bundle protein